MHALKRPDASRTRAPRSHYLKRRHRQRQAIDVPELTTIFRYYLTHHKALLVALQYTVCSTMAQALRANAGTQSKGGTCYRMRKSGPVARQPVACRGLVEDLLKPLTSMGQV